MNLPEKAPLAPSRKQNCLVFGVEQTQGTISDPLPHEMEVSGNLCTGKSAWTAVLGHPQISRQVTTFLWVPQQAHHDCSFQPGYNAAA